MALDELDQLYRDAILSHVRRPRNAGVVADAHLVGDSVNPFCGDEISLQLRLDDAGRVSGVGLQSEGCSINRAAGSMLSEAVRGKSLSEIEAMSGVFRAMMRGVRPTPAELESLGELEALSGVTNFPVRIKCALLAWAALDDGIEAYHERAG